LRRVSEVPTGLPRAGSSGWRRLCCRLGNGVGDDPLAGFAAGSVVELPLFPSTQDSIIFVRKDLFIVFGKQILYENVHQRRSHAISLDKSLVFRIHHDKLRRFVAKTSERPIIDDISIKTKGKAER
jgi:hypothetical protein